MSFPFGFYFLNESPTSSESDSCCRSSDLLSSSSPLGLLRCSVGCFPLFLLSCRSTPPTPLSHYSSFSLCSSSLTVHQCSLSRAHQTPSLGVPLPRLPPSAPSSLLCARLFGCGWRQSLDSPAPLETAGAAADAAHVMTGRAWAGLWYSSAGMSELRNLSSDVSVFCSFLPEKELRYFSVLTLPLVTPAAPPPQSGW